MYCIICGERNGEFSLVRFWDCDDGWRCNFLCPYCKDMVKDDKPKVGDYAFEEAVK